MIHTQKNADSTEYMRDSYKESEMSRLLNLYRIQQDKCILHTYIHNYIKNLALDHPNNKIREKIEEHFEETTTFIQLTGMKLKDPQESYKKINDSLPLHGRFIRACTKIYISEREKCIVQ